MSQVVNVLGYGPITFPDGMSKDEIATALKKLPPIAQAPVAPAQPTTVMGKLAAPIQRLGSQIVSVKIDF